MFFQAGALVLDPMCGLGTILLEAAKEWPVSIPAPAAGSLQGNGTCGDGVFSLPVRPKPIAAWKGETKPTFLGSC